MKSITKIVIFSAFLILLFGVVFAQAQPWDPLRDIAGMATALQAPTKYIVFLLSAAMFVIAFKAYAKKKTNKMLFVALAFLFFALKWLFKVIDLYLSPGNFLSDPSENVMELIILAMLFLAIFRK
ncbi:MAG: hypothetical protein ABID38_00810 [Candidatus Diapherotrites archaeon]